jgi:hypothetical protein
MQTHIRIAAILFLIFGGMLVIAACFSSLMFGGMAAVVGATREAESTLGAALLGFTGIALTIFLLAFAVPSLLCGWGLLNYKRWARLLGIVLASIALLKVPIGTIFGAYTLWVLFSKQSEPLFDGSAGSSS